MYSYRGSVNLIICSPKSFTTPSTFYYTQALISSSWVATRRNEVNKQNFSIDFKVEIEHKQILPNRPVAYRHADKIAKHSDERRMERYGKFMKAKTTTLIIMGDFKQASDSPMRGHPRSPHGKLMKELKKRSDVIIVPEYNTTKACAKCYKHLEVATPPERFSQCLCINDETAILKRKVWNRDINAAVNMRMLGEVLLRDIPRPADFTRGFQLEQQPHMLRRRNLPLSLKRDPDEDSIYSISDSE